MAPLVNPKMDPTYAQVEVPPAGRLHLDALLVQLSRALEIALLESGRPVLEEIDRFGERWVVRCGRLGGGARPPGRAVRGGQTGEVC